MLSSMDKELLQLKKCNQFYVFKRECHSLLIQVSNSEMTKCGAGGNQSEEMYMNRKRPSASSKSLPIHS